MLKRDQRGIAHILGILLIAILLAIPGYIVYNAIQKRQSTSSYTTVESTHWQAVFTKAFERVDCPAARDPNDLPDGYYKGPIIDTHVHMQSLPDSQPGTPLDNKGGQNLGAQLSIDKWVCMLDVEGTAKAFTFFPVWEPIIPESIDLVKRALAAYPNRFVPFIMPPDNDGSLDGFPTVTAAALQEMLSIEPGLFNGYGEIGLYSRDGGAPALPPDSPRLLEIYPLARERNLLVYMHLGFGHKQAIMKVAAANRDINFIFHGGQLYDVPDDQVGISHDPSILANIEEVLDKNPNVYYGVDELYGGDWLLEPGRSKAKFLTNFNNYAPLLAIDLPMWQGFIERHPDQVIWGTDRGVAATWDKDPDVALAFNNYTRAFIGKLDRVVQEKFAYKNAEQLVNNR
ncbi:amidohydrolase family protein [Candidatus Microgenomates bacterium]|nr:amidohydrolase family protein [Candidatus Microgenomates bacterium]